MARVLGPTEYKAAARATRTPTRELHSDRQQSPSTTPDPETPMPLDEKSLIQGRGPSRSDGRVRWRREGVTASHIHQQSLRLLDALFDADQETDGFAAVDHAVVVGEGEIHHRPRLNLVAQHHRASLDLVHAEDRRLRRIEDRRRHQRAVDTAVGDREGAAGEVLDGELAVPRLAAELADLLFYLGEAYLVGIA